MNSREYLIELFDYDSFGGELRWKERPVHHFSSKRSHRSWNSKNAGKVAGRILKRKHSSYIQVGIDGKRVYAHRIVWKIMTGEDPPDMIDHVDGNGTNNSWDNLCDGSNGVNSRNIKTSSRNTSGTKGVSWKKANRKWLAQVGLSGNSIHLGLYDNYDDAAKKVEDFYQENGFSDRHIKG